MILNKILIDNIKCKIIFLIKGMRHSEIKEIPRKYKSELDQLMKELQEYVSLEEYKKFFANILNIEIRNPVEQAEDIIKKFYENGDPNNGKGN